MSSRVLRPICGRLPYSSGFWEDTNLPFSCVISPLADEVYPYHEGEDDGDDNDNDLSALIPVGAIAKCLYCGAPQPTTTTQYPLHHSFLCYLCGNTSTVRFVDQEVARPNDGMQPHTYHPKPQSRANGQTLDFSIPLRDNKTQVPAMACPPLWWIVIDGCHTMDRDYCNVLGTSLEKVIGDIPDHVHVGMVISSSSYLSVWDLSSLVPSIKHYPWKQITGNASSSLSLIKKIPFVPASKCKPQIQTVLRALKDTGPMLMATGVDSQRESEKMPLGSTLEVLLDALNNGCHHPGMDEDVPPPEAPSKNKGEKKHASLPYAGCKVLFFLGGPPKEVGSLNKTMRSFMAQTTPSTSQTVGAGGLGGYCSEPGLRFDNFSEESGAEVPALAEDDPEMGAAPRLPYVSTPAVYPQEETSEDKTDPTDMTPANLQEEYQSAMANIEEYFQGLGQQCAHAAVGVDFLVLSSFSALAAPVGVPFLKLISERSGAAGPLLFDLNNQKDFSLLESEILVRTPWHRPMAFGGLLRLRLSKGFQVDSSPIELVPDEKGPQLGPLCMNGGLAGSASLAAASGASSDPLWQIGACDGHQTLMIDLQVTNRIRMAGNLEGMGEVALKHCMQLCFAFTTIVRKRKTGAFVTKRILRVVSINLPMTSHPEWLYSSLDTEALGVVLFHKLANSLYTDGLWKTRETGRSWLKHLLVCAYKSAEQYEKLKRTEREHDMNGSRLNAPTFYPNERLLNRGSHLTDVEILLGQGHNQLQHLPLLVWSLLQCDALRPSSESFRPTLDARCAALSQMQSMTPEALVKCVAPRLDLWASGTDATEPIMECLPLRMESISIQLMDAEQQGGKLLLLLDSPQRILVCSSSHIRASTSLVQQNPDETQVVVGTELESLAETLASSYRTPPPVLYALDLNSRVDHIWRDALIEDTLDLESFQNYDDWKVGIAAEVEEDVVESED